MRLAALSLALLLALLTRPIASKDAPVETPQAVLVIHGGAGVLTDAEMKYAGLDAQVSSRPA